VLDIDPEKLVVIGQRLDYQFVIPPDFDSTAGRLREPSSRPGALRLGLSDREIRDGCYRPRDHHDPL